MHLHTFDEPARGESFQEQPNMKVDVAIVGAGLAGLYALYKLRSLGLRCRVFDAAGDVGGTWFWNRYPGARCDIESFQYSYSFSEELEQEWRWSERYAAQDEIYAYLRHVADRFNLRNDITLNCRISSADFDVKRGLWHLRTADGLICEARFCVMATGVLSKPREIVLPGQERFAGPIYSTSNWPVEPIDLAGKSVAVIGTGASGTQLLPHLVDKVGSVTVFQRTPNFSVPTSNAPVDDNYEGNWKKNYRKLRDLQFQTAGAVIFDINERKASEASDDELKAEFERRWKEDGGLNFMRSFIDLSSDERSNEKAADFVRGKIAEIVKDPVVAKRLMPEDYPIDARRLATTDRGFYELFNRDDVRLVSVNEEPITEITPNSIVTAKATYPVDAIIMATGFESMIGAMMAIDITGADGSKIRDRWRKFPSAYLGVAVSGFPNLFVVNGPGAIGPLANMFTSSELVVDWITRCISHVVTNGFSSIEADASAEKSWMDHVQELSQRTLMVKASTSGYIYTNDDGIRVFLCYSGGFPTYGAHLARVETEGFAGFTLQKADDRVSATAS